MKRNDGQVSLAPESDEDVYKVLKSLCNKGLELGNTFPARLWRSLRNLILTAWSLFRVHIFPSTLFVSSGDEVCE
jgi:hypothetical protein